MADVGQLVNAKALAGLFGLTERRIQQMAKEDIIPKAERGKYPFVGAIRAYIKFLQERALGGESAATGGDIVSERTRLLKANADKSELEFLVMKGENLPKELVQIAWTKQIAAFRAKMLSIPVKLAADLHGIETKKHIEQVAKGLIWEALGELVAENGLNRDDFGAAGQGKKDSRPAA